MIIMVHLYYFIVKGVVEVHYDASFGTGTVWSLVNADVQCMGTEKSLFDCRMFFDDDCSHTNDVGIWCIPTDDAQS